ncbi:hypothetical protein [Winogradskyella bathintestinalis]|uniref:SGNH/GDSL hydrolase family protein n=1 Tax=Winogradskyella bathintestinalis TaxID=3035208 RepID=A0ABT7ZTU4_9FLAO|nr:hypothetical protein [Winogradskyella bathintestinalis]MDN3492426.1 hypothetical protein [Winogradskyella bathintestinalis]
MKLFIKNTVLFFMILYGSIFVLVVVSNYIINLSSNFKLKENTTKIVIGNSHPAGTFNDTLISNLKNLADPGESYFYGYQKLKKIVNQNPQVDTVYIEFNPKTILSWEDSKLWKKHQIPNYLPFFDLKDHYLLATINGLSYQQELIKAIPTNLQRIVKKQYNYIDFIGGYRHNEGSKIDSLLMTHKFDQKKQFTLKERELSKYDILYLKKIERLCTNKNIKLIFVRSPYHNQFDGHNYEDLFQTFRKENFSTIPFLDFKDFPTEDIEFKDLEHLNSKGANKFSKWFEEQNY